MPLQRLRELMATGGTGRQQKVQPEQPASSRHFTFEIASHTMVNIMN